MVAVHLSLLPLAQWRRDGLPSPLQWTGLEGGLSLASVLRLFLGSGRNKLVDEKRSGEQLMTGWMCKHTALLVNQLFPAPRLVHELVAATSEEETQHARQR